jgi:prophage regulatory protein
MEQDALASEIRLIRLREVMSICGMSRSSVYDAIKKGQFPSSIKLSSRSIAWLKSEVIAWAESRVKATRGRAVGNAAGSAGQRVPV